jgi:DNA-binding response OmpR family regulator
MTAPPDAPLILVVDDDPDTADLIAYRLARSGYRTAKAADGLAALRSIGHERPDLVLLDIDMPNLDGKAVARILAAKDDAPAFIFLTGVTGVGARVEGLKLGAADYVAKPYSSPDLLARIEVALRMRRDGNAAAQAG